MKQLIKLLVLATVLSMPATVYAEDREVSPEFSSSVIVTDEGMTSDYTYTMEAGKVDVKADEAALMVKGEFLPYKGVVKNGTTFVPVRVISESFGKEVKWNATTQQVTIEDIVLTINQLTAKKGMDNVTLTQAPFVEKGVTYVPLRFIAESLDKEVGYVPKSYKYSNLQNSIVWVEDKELMNNNGYKAEEIIEWLKPQLYTNKNYFETHGNTDSFKKEGIESMEYLGQLGRYAVLDAHTDNDILVDMYTKSVYFYYSGNGYSGILLEIKDGEYFLYDLDMSIKLPKEFEGKYYIGITEDSNEDRQAENVGLYHKASADKEEGYGLFFTIRKWDKEFSSTNPPLPYGGYYDLVSTPDSTYMLHYTTDLQAYQEEAILKEYFDLIDIVQDSNKFRESFNPIDAEKIPLD